MSDFHDHFSGHAADYRLCRPSYPDALFAWLADIAPARDLAWDCATGNGQAATGIAPYFNRVLATDASAEQIRHATPAVNVEYAVAPAEACPLADGTADLITVAQALHWFDHARFFREVARVARSAGVLAAWAYDVHRVIPAVDAVLDRFQAEYVGPYWPSQREHLRNGFRDIAFPWPAIPAPNFRMTQHWTLPQMLGYMSTWSATKRFMAERGFDPVAALTEDFARAWGDAESVREVRWQFHVWASRL